MHEEITVTLNWGIACYHSHQYILPSQKVSKNIKIILYRTIILSVALYGYEVSCLSLREEHLRVLENVVQRIFGPEREDITGDWTKLHNVELDDLYFSANIFVVIKPTTKMGRACGTCAGEETFLCSSGRAS